MEKRRNLVIVRAGDSSLHETWLNAAGEERSWDLIVSYFGDDPAKHRSDQWLRIDNKGLKFPALHDLITAHQDLIRQYEYVWFPDEDLNFTCASANRFLATCHEQNVALAQPSLTSDSYFAHPITLRCRFLRVRFTNFVEIMAPCLRSDILWSLLPTFNDNYSGWGLDYIWPALLAQGNERLAIVDEVSVRHSRPIGGGAYYKVLATFGKSAPQELNELLDKYGLNSPVLWCRSGITASGREVRGGIELLFRQLLSWCLAYPWGRMPLRKLPRFLASSAYRQFKGFRQGTRAATSAR